VLGLPPLLPLLLLLQNFFDAGSCIDGRLTSAWNWCSKIELKVREPGV
jgi:hypothetical protein